MALFQQSLNTDHRSTEEWIKREHYFRTEKQDKLDHARDVEIVKEANLISATFHFNNHSAMRYKAGMGLNPEEYRECFGFYRASDRKDNSPC